MISVLFRLIEADSGKIVIDNINIKTLGLHQLRQKISIIPQDPSLFSGSIRNNLDPFNEYDDEKMWSVLEESNLLNAIKSMEGGLDGVVSEGGSNLSVGQSGSDLSVMSSCFKCTSNEWLRTHFTLNSLIVCYITGCSL